MATVAVRCGTRRERHTISNLVERNRGMAHADGNLRMVVGNRTSDTSRRRTQGGLFGSHGGLRIMPMVMVLTIANTTP